MKSIIYAILLALFALNSGYTLAQNNWVVCQSIKTGEIAVFPNQCPSSWVFVRYA